MTLAVQSDDTVSRNMTLYAKMIGGMEELSTLDTPNYVTKTDAHTSFTFEVKGTQSDIESSLTIKNITEANVKVTYSLEPKGDGVYTVMPAGLTGGQTYKAELSEDSNAVFVDGGVVQPSSVRELNFITAKVETNNLSLADGIIYLPSSEVSEMTGAVLDGLYTASIVTQSENAQLDENISKGSFTYAGGLIGMTTHGNALKASGCAIAAATFTGCTSNYNGIYVGRSFGSTISITEAGCTVPEGNTLPYY